MELERRSVFLSPPPPPARVSSCEKADCKLNYRQRCLSLFRTADADLRKKASAGVFTEAVGRYERAASNL